MRALQVDRGEQLTIYQPSLLAKCVIHQRTPCWCHASPSPGCETYVNALYCMCYIRSEGSVYLEELDWMDGSDKHRNFTQETAARVLCEIKSQC